MTERGLSIELTKSDDVYRQKTLIEHNKEKMEKKRDDTVRKVVSTWVFLNKNVS